MSLNLQNQPKLFAVKAKKQGAPRSKVTYDLIPELYARINAIAQHLECSQSDVAIHLLAKGLSAFDAGQMNLRAIRRPHTCQLRFAYKLPTPRVAASPNAITQQPTLSETEEREGTR
jgi:hypothetical protein